MTAHIMGSSCTTPHPNRQLNNETSQKTDINVLNRNWIDKIRCSSPMVKNNVIVLAKVVYIKKNTDLLRHHIRCQDPKPSKTREKIKSYCVLVQKLTSRRPFIRRSILRIWFLTAPSLPESVVVIIIMVTATELFNQYKLNSRFKKIVI